MSSGEADVLRLIPRVRSLDAFTRCRALGCEVMVALDGSEPRCLAHGGAAVPQYETDADGAIVPGSERHCPPGADCE